MFIDEIKNRIADPAELSLREMDALRDLLTHCTDGYKITKSKQKLVEATCELGVSYPDPINAVTGYEYDGDKKNLFGRLSKQNGWCNQFSGKSQWLKVGRKPKEGAKPVHESNLYGNSIEIYAYEQTE